MDNHDEEGNEVIDINSVNNVVVGVHENDNYKSHAMVGGNRPLVTDINV
jgi:hypothetical protein